MDRLVVNLNGDVIIAKEPLGKTWREIAALMMEKPTVENLIEYRARIIAVVFGNVTVDRLLENLTISQITELSRKCDAYIAGIVNPRIVAIEKNSEGGAEKA